MDVSQKGLFAETPDAKAVGEMVREIVDKNSQPSAWELILIVEGKLGMKARWVIGDSIKALLNNLFLTRAQRDYLQDLWESDDWRSALCGGPKPARVVESTIDVLLRESAAYRNSEAFSEMVSFMANFRDYAPFNNMLIKLQNPSCSFFATQIDWRQKFDRKVKEDARPMLILAPMHPVMLVYDLDSTEGPPLPKELQQFSKFEGEWNEERLQLTIDNVLKHDLIRVDRIALSSTNSGYAAISREKGETKIRITLHKELDLPSQYGVLLHELAHVYLGHFGRDADGWWPSRAELSQRAMEVEAEAVAYIVSRRAGLKGTSSRYISRHLDDWNVLQNISLDMIAKVSGRLNDMGTSKSFMKRRSRVTPKSIKPFL